MNVLLLLEYPTLCGGERSLLTLLPRLQAAGCNFSAAGGVHGALAAAITALGIPLFPLRLHDDHGVRRPLADCRGELNTLLQRDRPDLLHANSLSMARLSGPVAAEAGLPSLGHLRDIVTLSRRAAADVNHHRRLLAVSHAVREFHAAQGIDGQRITVLYNGVDLDLFRSRDPTGWLHRELGLPPEAALVATIGQLGPRKGTDVFLAAAALLAPQWKEAHFLIVGERLSGKEESRAFELALHAAAASPLLSGRVHFLGWRGDVADIMPELTILAHAARQEPLGRVLLEAAASGRPIVATDVGGTREIFPGPHPAAVLVQPDDPRGLADVLLALARDMPRQRALGEASRQRACEEFDACRAADNLLAHYCGVA